MSEKLNKYYAVVPLSLESLFEEELKQLGITEFKSKKAGCFFTTTTLGMMKANLWTRYASRILLQVGERNYRTEDDIYKFTFSIPWENYFTEKQSIKISLSAKNCPLKSINFLTLRVKDAVCDRFRERSGARPDVEKHNPDIQIFVFVDNQKVTLYLDTSGESLFKRGWRRDKGEAPLKENLAAGLIGLSGWEPSQPLYDPFCGSGTIIIEAATIAINMAPGITRRFGFEKFKFFNSEIWQALKTEGRAAINWDVDINLAGSDISTQIIEKASKNAQLAGLTKLLIERKIKFFPCDAREARPTSETSGVIIANPPYGEQSNPKSASVASMMKNVADNLKHNFENWVVWMLTSDLNLPRQMRLQESRKIVIFNGPLECRFFRFLMIPGSNRRESKAVKTSSPKE